MSELVPDYTLDTLERNHITLVLDMVNYNYSKAATLLGIDRTTLYNKAKRFGVWREKIVRRKHATASPVHIEADPAVQTAEA